MANVLSGASFYIDVCNSIKGKPITNSKLNKTLYFAQGCHLARTGEPLFQDAIEAWDGGPIVPMVYHRFSDCGQNPIKNAGPDCPEGGFSEEELDTITDAMREFGQRTGGSLYHMILKVGTPWSVAYNAGQKEIPTDFMREYFLRYPVPYAEQ